jgi:hypothetical protein
LVACAQGEENGASDSSSEKKEPADGEEEGSSSSSDEEDEEDYSYAENGNGEVIDVYVPLPPSHQALHAFVLCFLFAFSSLLSSPVSGGSLSLSFV